MIEQQAIGLILGAAFVFLVVLVIVLTVAWFRR